VTRLGEFSLIGRLFSLGSFSENNLKNYVLIVAKMCWVTPWAIFSQAHLVTLKPDRFSKQEKQTKTSCKSVYVVAKPQNFKLCEKKKKKHCNGKKTSLLFALHFLWEPKVQR
jgi:hypothetical protein